MSNARTTPDPAAGAVFTMTRLYNETAAAEARAAEVLQADRGRTTRRTWVLNLLEGAASSAAVFGLVVAARREGIRLTMTGGMSGRTLEGELTEAQADRIDDHLLELARCELLIEVLESRIDS